MTSHNNLISSFSIQEIGMGLGMRYFIFMLVEQVQGFAGWLSQAIGKRFSV